MGCVNTSSVQREIICLHQINYPPKKHCSAFMDEKLVPAEYRCTLHCHHTHTYSQKEWVQVRNGKSDKCFERKRNGLVAHNALTRRKKEKKKLFESKYNFKV